MTGTASFDTILHCNLEPDKHPKHDSEKCQRI
jgi:hypothetical protein